MVSVGLLNQHYNVLKVERTLSVPNASISSHVSQIGTFNPMSDVMRHRKGFMLS